MKFLPIFSVIALCAITFLSSCKNEGDAARDAAVDRVAAPSTDAATPAPASPATPEPAQNGEGVWHYTCSNGCEGGAGSAIACAKCGTTLVHNAAYHGNASPFTATAPTDAATPAPATPATTTPATPTPEPAQNAAGVWHYTCSNGCEGGAGSAVACSKCGKTLAHNAAYHQ